MYNLKKNENGDVWYIKKAGSAYVKATMPIGKAEGIIGTGKVKESDKFEGFEICVDGEYYFAGTVASDEPEKPADEPKDEDKTYEDHQFKKNKWRK